MKKIIIENKWKLALSLILILVPQIVAFEVGESIYYLPLQCLVIHGICLGITFYDWRKRPQEKRVVNLVIWLMPIISIAGSSLILLVKTANFNDMLIPYFMNVGLGIMFIVLGSYFPKIRQNRTLGIKVKWALEDEENWNSTHLFGGKVWIICGVVCLLCGLFPFNDFGIVLLIAAILAAAVIPMVYSWMFYRKRVRSGEIVQSKCSRKSMIATGLFTMVTIVFLVWVMLAGNMTILFQDDNLAIEASGWGDYEVKYEDIESIDYEPGAGTKDDNGRRTNGFGNLKMSMGHFYNERFGDYIRYTFNDCKDWIVLNVQDDIVVINAEDEVSTKEIYNTLSEKLQE